MCKRYNSFHYQGEGGFTLVEILVAMVILLLIVTACFPLFTMATKTTHENRARMTAAELAKRQLEQTLAQVTPSNYVNEGTDPNTAPLSTGISSTFYFDDNGKRIAARDSNSRFARFEARKIVEWVDDPADGEHPTDKLPFDYKVLIIEVSCPSLFTGNVLKQADFKTFVAREGASSPITGIIVEVVRGWTDADGNRIPLEGATVNLDGSGPSQSAMTNSFGQALFPITFPDDSTVYSYEAQAEYSGMIPRPDQAAVAVTARPYTTSYVQVEMETPATLTLRFAPSQADVNVSLDGGAIMAGIQTKTIAAGESSVSFTNLWPAGIDPDHPGRVCSGGTYSIKVAPLLAYRSDLSSADIDPASFVFHLTSTELEKNLWYFYPDYNGSPAWVAAASNYPIGAILFPAGQHRLAYPATIDITEFKSASPDIQASLTSSFTSSDSSDTEPAFYLSDFGSLGPDFTLVYLGEENAALTSDSNADWKSLILVGQLNPSGQLDSCTAIDNAYLSKKFQLRFDSDPGIGTFYFRNFNIHCSYSDFSIQFTGPGDSLNKKVSGS